MSRLVFNRTGGAADEYGHLQALNRLLIGDVIEGMQVVAKTSPNMSVTVGPGSARVSTGTYPTSYGYWVAIDTTTGSPVGENVTITTAPSSNSRIDTIVAYVNVGATATTSPVNNPGMLVVAAVPGTVASSPVAPSNATIQSAISAANPFIKLANVLVGTSVTQINSGNITDVRTYATINSQNASAPWQVWTPTLTNITIVNGTITGKFQKVGKTIFARALYTKGSSDSYGAGVYEISLPASPAYTPANFERVGTIDVNGGAGNIYQGALVFHSASPTVLADMYYANGSSPTKWAGMASSTFAPGVTGLTFAFTFSYEIL